MIAGSTQHLTALLNAKDPQSFLEAYEKLKDPLTLNDLRVKALYGSNKGVSVLWCLIAFIGTPHPQTLNDIWDKFKNNIILDDFRYIIEDGIHKGKSVFWGLATAVANGYPQAFDDVWNKFKNDITIDDLRAKAENGLNKGISALWGLAVAATNGHPQAFDAVWNRFKNDITLDDLRANAENGPSKGKSALWWLTAAAARGTSQVFVAIWDKFKNNITLDDLRFKAEEGTSKEMSLLWRLAAAAANGHPQAFEAVWDKFKNIISIDDLRTKPKEGPYQGKSVLWLIAFGLLKNHQLSLNDTFREILTQIPSVLNDQELAEKPDGSPSFAELISQHPDISWREATLNLIAARNTLFAAIKAQQEKTLLEEQDIKALSELAHQATGAGYLNAFYDIGLLFFEKKNPEAACSSFQELPPTAKQFTSAYSQAASTLLGQAMNEKNDNERHEHLEVALWFALRLIDNKEKINLLQKIAYCHVTQGQGILGTLNFFNENSLMCLNEGSPLKSCFKLFEKLYQLEKLKSAQQKRSTALESLAASYTPGFISAAQTQEIPIKITKEPEALVQINPPQGR